MTEALSNNLQTFANHVRLRFNRLRIKLAVLLRILLADLLRGMCIVQKQCKTVKGQV